RNTHFVHDFLGPMGPDPMNVLQCNDDPFVGRDVDAGNACHSLAPVTASSAQNRRFLPPTTRKVLEKVVQPALRGHNAETTPPLLQGPHRLPSFLQTDAGYYWIPPPLVNLRAPRFPGLTPHRLPQSRPR